MVFLLLYCLNWELEKHSPPWIVTDHLQIPPCLFLYPLCLRFACSGQIRFIVCTQWNAVWGLGKFHCKQIVNLSITSGVTYFVTPIFNFFIFWWVFSTWGLNEVCSGSFLSILTHSQFSWLLKHDLRWCEEVSCWLISMQPWTPLWASGPSRLLTEQCAKDKASISVLRAVCDRVSFFLLLSAVSFQSKLAGCISRSDKFCVNQWVNRKTQMHCHFELHNNGVRSLSLWGFTSLFCCIWRQQKNTLSHSRPYFIFSNRGGFCRRIMVLNAIFCSVETINDIELWKRWSEAILKCL